MQQPARLFSSLFLLLIAVCGSADAALADDYQEARQEFQQAYSRAAAGQADPAAADSERLKNYPLYPYLVAARIRQSFNGSPEALAVADERAAAFVGTYAQLPVGRGLRRAWLDSLAKRAQWRVFLDAYRDSMAADSMRCQSFEARLELQQTDGLAADVAKQWLTPRSVPECDRAFAWLKDSGGLTPELIEQRARMALETGNAAFASQLVAQLSADRAAPLAQWGALLDSPQRAIDKLIAAPDTAVDKDALLAGWTRLARTNPPAAKERYDKLVRARSLQPEVASRYALALALALAWNRDPDSLAYFNRVAAGDFDDTAREWQARAALWSKDWQAAARSIGSMSATNAQTARWRYWSARIAEQTHRSSEARHLYESLLADDNYYSALAAAHLHRSVVPHPAALSVNSERLTQLERLPAFERARELFFCRLRAEALTEWQLGYESIPAEWRQQTIPMAAGWGWYEQAVATATLLHVFNDYALLYPHPFDAEVSAAARAAELAPETVYGVVRQESLYRTDAVSDAGARGLMQLQPETARRTARFLKRPQPSVADLFDPSTNIALGAARLRMLLDQFDGQLPVALAGYNAGSTAVTRWLPATPLDADIWIENIPYNETRGYVQRVLWHSVLFRWLLEDGKPTQTGAWLTAIKQPRA